MDLLLKSNKKGLLAYLKQFPHQGGIIVNDELKFIFMRAGKVAGTSVLTALQESGIDFFYSKKYPERFQQWIDSVDDAELENYFIFSVVRNPFDRFISAARYLKIPEHDLATNFDKHNETEAVFLHTLPISHYTHREGVLFVDYICRFEALQFDLNLVCDHLNIKRVDLPVTNRSNRTVYQHYYDEDLRKQVAGLYPNDIQYYGYSFEKTQIDTNSSVAYYKERLSKKKTGLLNKLGLSS